MLVYILTWKPQPESGLDCLAELARRQCEDRVLDLPASGEKGSKGSTVKVAWKSFLPRSLAALLAIWGARCGWVCG